MHVGAAYMPSKRDILSLGDIWLASRMLIGVVQAEISHTDSHEIRGANLVADSGICDFAERTTSLVSQEIPG
jgi:hypothetical protein